MDRVPPNDLGAEQCVLGAMMLSRDAADLAANRLCAMDFYRPAHGAVFTVIADAVADREPVDAIAIASRLEAAGELARVGGAPYLHTLVAAVPLAVQVGYYAGIVSRHAHVRRFIEYATKVGAMAYEPDANPEQLGVLAAKLLADVGEVRESVGLIPMADIINPALNEIQAASDNGRYPGLTTGIGILDDATGGLRKGQLIIVAGRPGMGKSVLGVEIAKYAAMRQNKTAAIFSLEMSKEEITNRILSSITGIRLELINRGQLSQREWDQISNASAELGAAPLYIDDSAPVTLPLLMSRARRLHARKPLSLIVVDYLQLLEIGRRSESRQNDVAEMSRGLKLLAKELEVPVVAAAQLNRGPEQRMDKRPQLSDLRESGALENDADLVLMLFRPKYYDVHTLRNNELDLILAKNRHGPNGTLTALGELEFARIIDKIPH